MNGSLASAVADYLAHKRALGRKFQTEEATLRLLLAFADQHDVNDLRQLTPGLLDEFVASRRRQRARSFNHLVGVVGCFLDWAVTQRLLEASPLHRTRRRETAQRLPFLFDPARARRLIEAAAALPDNSRAIGRGPTYRAVFGLCYGLGLRAGEACSLRLGDVDADRQLLVVRGGKFGKSRLVPHGPRITLILFLYNTGTRVQEVADLRAGHLQLGDAAVVRLHGKGDKWRTCPLWRQTADLLAQLLISTTSEVSPADAPVFCSATGQALTRFGIYKIVRRHAGHLDNDRTNRKVSPHIFRHTAAVHLLEAGVEVNVIRGWLGHADLTTTNRYAEINTRAKIEALSNTEPPSTSAEPHAHPVWRTDESLLNWLSSL